MMRTLLLCTLAMATLACSRSATPVSDVALDAAQPVICAEGNCQIDSVFRVLATRVGGKPHELPGVLVLNRPILFQGVATGIEVDSTGHPFAIFRLDSTREGLQLWPLPEGVDTTPTSIDIGPEGDRIAVLREAGDGRLVPQVLDWPSGAVRYQAEPIDQGIGHGALFCYFGTASFVLVTDTTIAVHWITDDGRTAAFEYRQGGAGPGDWKCHDEAKVYDRSQGTFKDNQHSNGRNMAVSLTVSSDNFTYTSRLLIQGMTGFRESVLECTLARPIGSLATAGPENCSDGVSSGDVRYEYSANDDQWIRSESGANAGPPVAMQREGGPSVIPIAAFESWLRVTAGSSGHAAGGPSSTASQTAEALPSGGNDRSLTGTKAQVGVSPDSATFAMRYADLVAKNPGWALPDTVAWTADYQRTNTAARLDFNGDGIEDRALFFVHSRPLRARLYLLFGLPEDRFASPLLVFNGGISSRRVGVFGGRPCSQQPCHPDFLVMGFPETDNVTAWRWDPTKKRAVAEATESDEEE